MLTVAVTNKMDCFLSKHIQISDNRLDESSLENLRNLEGITNNNRRFPYKRDYLKKLSPAKIFYNYFISKSRLHYCTCQTQISTL
jgi:hypothetical protein